MAWLLLLLVLVLWTSAAVAAACGALLAYGYLQKVYRRQLESAEAKWHLQHQQDSPGTVIECVSVGWLNLLLQSLWTPVLEKHVSGLTTELLQKVFAEVLAKGANKAPWRYLDSIEVEEIGFGLVPPAFQVVQAKFDPTASMLTLSMDVRFTSSSAQAVLLVRSKAVGVFAPVSVRLEVTHVKLRGRLRMGLLLGQESPGIQGVYYSFTSPPHLDVAVRPLGLPLPSVVPGVDTALRGVLTKLISRRMVEPQRRYLDIHRIYLNKHIARVGGPGGLLKLVVVGATNLGSPKQQQAALADAAAAAAAAASSSTADKTATAADAVSSKISKAAGGSNGTTTSNNVAASAAAKLSSYCEVKFGRAAVLRTPIVHHSAASDCSWNWQFSLALPFELSSWPGAAGGAVGGGVGGGSSNSSHAQQASTSAASRRSSASGVDGVSSDELSLVVYDAQTVGQAVSLGKAKVSLCALQLQPNGSARTLTLPLHKAGSSRATVQLSVQWLKSTKQQPSQQQQQRATRVQQSGQRAPAAVADANTSDGTAGQQSAAVAVSGAAGAGGVGVPPTSKQPVPRSVSAFVASAGGKGVSWQDKTQLRVRSAATAAKTSLRQLVSSNSAPDADADDINKLQQPSALQAAAEDVAAEPGGAGARGGVGAESGPAAAGGGAGGGSLLRRSDAMSTGVAGAAGDSSPAAAFQGTKQSSRRQLSAAPPAALQAAAADALQTDSESPTPSVRSLFAPTPSSSKQHRPAGAAGADDARGVLEPGMRSSSSKGWLAGWGAWLWPDGSEDSSDAAAAGGTGAAGAREGSSRPQSTLGRGSPWGGGSGLDADDGTADSEAGWLGSSNSPDSNDSAGGAGSTPLSLLSHVVHMQKELEQQRAQLEAMQQQLEHTSNSYQRLKQVCRQRGRAALLSGARFCLHKADGSTQHILLYLTHAGSSRGVHNQHHQQQASRFGRPSQPLQQQQGDAGGFELVIAALPETRREARQAFKRLAASGAVGAVEVPLSASTAGAAAAADGGGASHRPQQQQQQQHGGSAGAAASGSSAAGGVGSSAAAAAASTSPPRLSAFGTVGAGLRLRLQRGTILQMGYESGKLPRSALQVLKVIPAGNLVGVVRGNAHFVVPAAAAAVAANSGSSGGGISSTECFTLLVQESGSSAHVTAINLQLPPTGNSRGIDEWLLALRDVAVVRTAPAAAAVPVERQEHVGAARASTAEMSLATADAAAGAAAGVATAVAAASAADGWLLPAAAAATPQPWAGHAASAGGASERTGSSVSSDDDDADTDSTDD